MPVLSPTLKFVHVLHAYIFALGCTPWVHLNQSTRESVSSRACFFNTAVTLFPLRATIRLCACRRSGSNLHMGCSSMNTILFINQHRGPSNCIYITHNSCIVSILSHTRNQLETAIALQTIHCPRPVATFHVLRFPGGRTFWWIARFGR